MPGNADETRRRILESGYAFFYRQGFNRVGVDEIARAAGVTKRTLYYHFRSKDELLASVLQRQHELALAQVRNWAEGLSGGAHEVFFRGSRKTGGEPRYSGAGFTRVAMELADLPGHPARAVARGHKAAIEQLIADVLARAGVQAPAESARETALLLEGAMALMLVHGDRAYAEAAAGAAKKLIASQSGFSSRRRNRAPARS